MSAKSKSKRVAKSEWLSAALDMLANGGVEAVRIDRIARKLRISRSSFYWHFRDRQDLLGQILDHWADEYTDVVIRNISALGGPPQERLAKTMEMIERYDLARYDLAVRAWAKQDPLAEAAVREVNKKRLEFVRLVFAELAFEGDDLEMRTMLFVCYHTWERSMFFDMPASKLTKLQRLRLDLLTCR